MLCDECGEREAVVSVVIATGNGETHNRMLCMECAEHFKAEMENHNLPNLLSSLMQMFARKMGEEKKLPAEPKAPAVPRICDSCGTSYEQFVKSGQVGCAQCYDAFSDEIRKYLIKNQNFSEPAEKAVPGIENKHEQDPVWVEVQKLEEDMRQAVAKEDYEAAAVCRDRIHELTRIKESHCNDC